MSSLSYQQNPQSFYTTLLHHILLQRYGLVIFVQPRYRHSYTADNFNVTMAPCTPYKAGVLVSFLVTLWNRTYDFGAAVGHPIYQCAMQSILSSYSGRGLGSVALRSLVPVQRRSSMHRATTVPLYLCCQFSHIHKYQTNYSFIST